MTIKGGKKKGKMLSENHEKIEQNFLKISCRPFFVSALSPWYNVLHTEEDIATTPNLTRLKCRGTCGFASLFLLF